MAQAYLDRQRVPEVLTAMVESLCVHTPADSLAFMRDFLASYKHSDRQRSGLDGDSSDESEDITFETIETEKSEAIRRRYSTTERRSAVSSEIQNMTSLLKEEEAPMPSGRSANPPEVRERIEKCLMGNFLFAQLPPESLTAISSNMFEYESASGHNIITQYDQADNFYVIEQGICHVFVKSSPDQEAKQVSELTVGSCFGELALMYGTPRAATVKSVTDVKAWALDRETYRRILLRSMWEKRKRFEDFLKRVPILDTLTDYERLTIADALQPATFEEEEVIVSEGDEGDSFYLILEGEVRVTQSGEKGDGTVKQLTTLNTGDFFGEVALMLNQPRVATCTSITKVQLAKLDRRSFQRLLGPIQDILKRNMDTYSLYIKEKI